MTSTALREFWRIGTKIVCVGRNYKEHALELGNPIPKKPVIFVKTTNSYITEGNSIKIPHGCKNLQQEVELGVIFGKVAKCVKKADAMNYIAGYTVALDMTARDFQNEAKSAGHPWFLAKSFDCSCPISGFIERSKIADPHNEELFCYINGREQQRCKTNAMTFDIPTLIEYITQLVTMYPGDMLLTGTPAGVCKVESKDEIEFGLTKKITAKFTID
uniref:Oxaloacetate tautomerase FAHD1, mitochondrial n=1 Tax=Syphacia muris TaxID=451379 RepID=A0A0N5ANX4_9BILA